MGKTFSVSQGKQMTTHVGFGYRGTGGIYDVQIRLGYHDREEFIPEEWLDWSAEGVMIGKYSRGIDVECPVPYNAAPGIYDAECSIRIPGRPYPEDREVKAYRDNAVKVTKTITTVLTEEV